MKLYILSGALVFLIAGIMLAGNSLEVSGQSALDKAKDILGTTPNATVNGTGGFKSQAENLLGLGSDSESNATQTAMNKTMNLLSNLNNNITNEELNTSSNLT